MDKLTGTLRESCKEAPTSRSTPEGIVRALFGLSDEQAAAFQQANDELYLCELAAGKPTRFWKLVSPAR